MAPKAAAEAVRACDEEANRLKQATRVAHVANRVELEKIRIAMKGLVTLAEEGKGTRTLVDRLPGLEARKMC